MDCKEKTLHKAESRKEARLLFESVPLEKRQEYVLHVDDQQRTALHVQIAHDRTDVIEYLCSLFTENDTLLLANDSSGGTALHYAKTGNAAKLLVKSVSHKNYRHLTLSADKNQYTALHMAAYNGKTDVVEYLCSLPVKDDLVLARSSTGETALHVSSNQKIAQTLVESVTPEKKKDFILSVADNQLTALHVAASKGRIDVVKYLCGLPVKDDLMLARVSTGETALHCSFNQRVAQLLVESVTSERQKEFILSSNKYKVTALHVAASNGRTDVVEYLCSLPEKDDLVLARGSTGKTALHCSSNKKIAQLLVESLKPDRQRYFVYMITFYCSTALHIAAQNGRADVVEYLCRLYPNELPLKKDLFGNTALHLSKNVEIAKVILKSVTNEQQKHLLGVINNFQHTALHENVILGKADVVQYLCNLNSNIDEVILMKDKHGRTPLYYVDKKSIAEILITTVKKENKAKFLSTVDYYGQTPLHRATISEIIDIVEYLCNINTTGDELILTKDNNFRSALHYATNEKIAKLLLEAVTPERQRELLFSVDAHQRTALHIAATDSNKTEVVQYLCNLNCDIDEVILMKDKYGRTPLYYVDKKSIAEILITTVKKENKAKFLSTVDYYGQTPLHRATISERIDIVEYLCNINTTGDELILTKDKYFRSALHYAANEKIAKLLLEAVTPERQRELLFSVDAHQRTALHIAATDPNKTEVVQYLCSISLVDDELMHAKDFNGATALHLACDDHIVNIILHHLVPEKLLYLLTSEDSRGNTPVLSLTTFGHSRALIQLLEHIKDLCRPEVLSLCLQKHNKLKQNILHLVALSLSFEKLYDVLEEYILFCVDVASMMYPDVYGKTPIHYAAAKCGPVMLGDFMLCLSLPMRQYVMDHLNRQQTTSMAEPFFDTEQNFDKVLEAGTELLSEINYTIPSFDGFATVLNNMFNMFPFAYDENERFDKNLYIDKLPEVDSNITIDISPFPISTLTLKILNGPIIYNVCHETIFKMSRNISYQYLLPSIPINSSSVIESKSETRQMKRRKGSEQDSLLFIVKTNGVEGPRQRTVQNTPGNHLNRQQTPPREILARPCVHAKLSVGQVVERDAEINNDYKEFCSIPKKIQIDHARSPSRPVYSERNIKMLNYTLNRYSLSNNFSTPSLFRGSEFKEKEEGSPSGQDHLFMIVDIADEEEPIQETVQNKLHNMDTSEYHGKPKLAVIQSSVAEPDLNLIPPGPDYLILSVKYHTDSYERNPVSDMEKHGSIHSLISELSCNPYVQKVSVNSTLNKRYIRDKDEYLAYYGEEKALNDVRESDLLATLSVNKLVISGHNRGRALIICNNLEISSNPPSYRRIVSEIRSKTLTSAKRILADHFGFDVTVQCNLPAEEMLSSISEFSKSEEHGSMAALAIFSHGKDGLIYGHGENSNCSIQEVVNNFNAGTTACIPKLLFLSCCRGDIPVVYDRAPHSFESSDEFPCQFIYKPISQQLPPSVKAQEWNRNYFKPLDVPIDCYICFTTLPDSRSKPGMFFKYFSEHLSDLTNSKASQLQTAQEIERCTTSKDSLSNQQLPPDASVGLPAPQPVQRVELVDLLTDVAGVMREKFRSKQCFNLCYSVNRESEQIYIDLLPVFK